MKLLVKAQDIDIRLAHLANLLNPEWVINPVDINDKKRWSHELMSADAVITMDWDYHNQSFERLKLIHLPGAGLDAINFKSVPDKVTVCNVFEHEVPISEYVISSILMWTTRIHLQDRLLRKNDWSGSHLFGPTHQELCGKTIGILGYGRIGKAIASRIKPFGVDVIACGPRAPASGVKPDNYYPLSQLSQFLSKSDFLVIAAPLTDETHDLIGNKELTQMKPNSVLINIARGTIVNEKAIFNALKTRAIEGAIIDTWYHYPENLLDDILPSNYDFSKLENVIMTPHSSAWTDGLILRRNRVIAENLNRLSDGRELMNVVSG
ncbi:MAG: 2-hydroxyacid dehydrogenase [Betaproteobacteria bacterium]